MYFSIIKALSSASKKLANLFIPIFKDLINFLDHGDFLLLNHSHLNKKDIIKIKEVAENKGIHIYRLLSSKRYLFLKDRNIKGLFVIGPLKLILSRKSRIWKSL